MPGCLATPAILMQINYLRIYIFSICILIALQLSAVRAIPGIVTVQQPDGSLLSVRLHGDEHFHYITTSDNLMITQKADGSYHYAANNGSGLQTSTFRAKNPEQRSSEEIRFLKNTDQKSLLKAKRKLLPKKIIAAPISSDTLPLGKRLMNLVKGGNIVNTRSENKVKGASVIKELVILLNFSDTAFTTTSPQSSFYNLFNQTGYSANGSSGSVRDFYKDNSMGLITFDFTVTAPITLPHTMAYYGANDGNGDDIRPSNMITDACQIISSSIDFSQFDNDGDGYVDNVFIVYAGHNEAEGGPASSLWPHKWTLAEAGVSLPSYNGVKINAYACTSELRGTATSKTMAPIGTFCHEFGHTLGLVDLYDVDYNGTGTEAGGLANWDLMSTGNYNNSGRTPPFLSAIDRFLLGWCDTHTPSTSETNTLLPIGTSNQVFRIDLPTANEFYLVENRQVSSWDSYVNGHGMLITHIDMTDMTVWKTGKVNNDPAHQYADLIEADGNETYSANGIAGDPYPGTTKKTEFSDASYPAMGSWYSSTKMRKPITDIVENTNISFNYCGGPNGSLQTPVATKATQINDTSFVANWETIDGNNIEYYLDVYYKDYVSTTENFTAFQTEMNANGWSGQCTANTSMYNSAPCSITLTAGKDTLSTPLFSGTVRSLSFWGMSDGTPGSSLKIEAYNGISWQTLTPALTLSNTPGTYTFSTASTPPLPDGTVKIRFTTTGSTGKLYIDDVTVSYYGNVYLNCYHNANMGTSTSTLVHPVVKNKTYYYVARAQSPIFASPNSNVIAVIPIQNRNSILANAYASNGNLIVEAHDINSNSVQVYTITGQKIISKDITKGIHNLGILQPHALYIVVINGRSFKVIF
jgi:M6 family metalloprotease-like protein